MRQNIIDDPIDFAAQTRAALMISAAWLFPMPMARDCADLCQHGPVHVAVRVASTPPGGISSR